ncbi:hypothetical protein J8Z24_17835 [Pseudoalteromonas sp. SCSIO 43201]|uniref:Uncharacterized protein n=1 Tax=Pseudoalteromonas peptidolytica F12-50-A1 TaxID=1315280 RepID=A0A8I0T5I7_9GAMM|nr:MULTISPECIES: hypothetical protein [Pseudoalteromonas]MBE0348511.1 hypothetical protein [Pseudoalteromonas peptidolytica F12-50-A1]NLR17033.1 hypothetical protein [Pseudoalteromonas peptidolytica]USD30833.1 hypothetical protein J8Z24_17835 [Pseudoalteromonas sp. SCSIO 43201]GEK09998.1 hypothetical protein PPE03_22470 [Pseudoalteromonas peptidolytica]
MNDLQGILSEYLPLQLIRFGEVYGPEDDPDMWLSEYDFIWRPIVDEGEQVPQLYLGDEPMRFGVDCETDKAGYIKQSLGHQPLRLPEISSCWGDSSLMLRNDLLEGVEFSPILGVTRTSATIVDAAGDERTGFTALSFHKVFFHERARLRFENIPVSKRLIIRMLLKRHSDTFFIHKSLLAKWKELDIETVCFNIKAHHLSFKTLCNLEMYYGSVGSNSYQTLDDFQHNRKANFWDELDG